MTSLRNPRKFGDGETESEPGKMQPVGDWQGYIAQLAAPGDAAKQLRVKEMMEDAANAAMLGQVAKLEADACPVNEKQQQERRVRWWAEQRAKLLGEGALTEEASDIVAAALAGSLTVAHPPNPPLHTRTQTHTHTHTHNPPAHPAGTPAFVSMLTLLVARLFPRFFF